MIDKAREMIDLSNEQIVISAWNREIEEITDELKEASSRNVSIILFSFTKISKKFGELISYEIDEDKLRKVWKPKMILVVDKKYTMMGSARKHDDSRSIFTENQAITEIATDHLILDITLAGNRLGFDSTKVVSSILDKSDFKLESLYDPK